MDYIDNKPASVSEIHQRANKSEAKIYITTEY